MDLKKDVKKGSGMGNGLGFSGFGVDLGMSGMGLGGTGLKDATEDKFTLLVVLLTGLSFITGVVCIFLLLTGLLGCSLEILGFVPTADADNLSFSIIASFITFICTFISYKMVNSIESDYKRMRDINRGNSMLRREFDRKYKTSKGIEKEEENDFSDIVDDEVDEEDSVEKED